MVAVLVYVVAAAHSPVLAQSKKACDVCGFCQGNTTYPGSESAYKSCVSCVYAPITPILSDDNPTLSADPSIYPLRTKSYTMLGCIETTASGFTDSFLRLLSNLVTGLGFLGIVYGGLTVMIARGDKNRIAEGKGYVTASIFAIAIVNFAVFIVRFAGKNVLQIPFFG
ncbi:MAG: hypothetical protein AAB649_01940 [Patescibacteria group bacterium]